LRNLDQFAREELPILVLEPSCASSLTDDLPDLVGDATLGARVAARVELADHFLARELAAGRCHLDLHKREGIDDSPVKIRVHGHCHQKALYGMGPTLELLRRIPNAEVNLIDAGCCGMAGAFGYEKEHYELSLRIGEDRLFPALRAAGAGELICANGFSCRHQVADVVNRDARHALEWLQHFLPGK
jgi:Fe-S oxidoreductase